MHNLHLQLFYRITKEHREIYLLKIVALSLAMACGIIIAMFAIREFGYDRSYQNPDNVVRILQRNETENYPGNRLSSRIPTEVFRAIQNEYSEELVLSRVKILEHTNLVAEGKLFTNQRIHAADTTLSSIFSLILQSGSIDDFKNRSRSVLMSASGAQRYFGTPDAVDKTLVVYTWEDSIEFSVAGIFHDLPENTHDNMDVVIGFDEQILGSLHFSPHEVSVYGRISAGTEPHALGQAFRASALGTNGPFTYSLQPLPDIYFGPRVEAEQAKHGDIYSVTILICIAGLICFLSLTNFINLTTLTLPQRSRELAMKKVFGASGFNLLMMLLKEYLIITFLSMLFALLLLLITNPWSVSLLSIDFMHLMTSGDPAIILVIIALFVATVVSPLIIALRFTRASATRLLSAETITFPAFKRNVTVFQLGVSLSLLVAGFMINRQIQYSLIKEPGKNHDQVIYMKIPASLTAEQLYFMKRHWKNTNPHIVEVIVVSHLPDNINSKSLNREFYFLAADYDFLEFFKLSMKGGRWFLVNDFDSSIVNEAGEAFDRSLSPSPIGTITNFSGTYDQPEKPILIEMAQDHDYNFLCIRILEVNIRSTIATIEKMFEAEPGIKVSFWNRNYRAVVQYENRLGQLTDLLTLISALMSCFAIYGLSLSVSRDMMKQIAVHKMFGATMFDVVKIFFKLFARQLGIAIVIFGPVTYIFLNEWLRIFVYAADFRLVDSLIAIGFCIVIIFITCSAQAFRLNRENLVGILKGG